MKNIEKLFKYFNQYDLLEDIIFKNGDAQFYLRNHCYYI